MVTDVCIVSFRKDVLQAPDQDSLLMLGGPSADGAADTIMHAITYQLSGR